MIYFQMIWEFFKTGLFAIGGGLATLPFLNQMGAEFGWFTAQELTDMLAISESTPGPIGINMSTYVGNTLCGIPGGILATFSLVLPSYIIIMAIQKALSRYQNNLYVQGIMQTLKPASVGMVSAAILTVLQSSFINSNAIAAEQWEQVLLFPHCLFFSLLFLFYIKFNKLHPTIILGIGALLGIIFQL